MKSVIQSVVISEKSNTDIESNVFTFYVDSRFNKIEIKNYFKKEFDASVKTAQVESVYCSDLSAPYTLILSDMDYSIYRVFGNLKNVTVVSAKSIDVDSLTLDRHVLLSKLAYNFLQEAL